MSASGVTQQHDQSTHIILKVKVQDGDEIYFRIERDLELEKLMNAYCDKRSVEMKSMHFLFYGRPLRGDLTPNERGMKDGDKIDVMFRKAREMLVSRVTQQHDQSTHINLKVNGQNGDEDYFEIKRDQALEELMNTYCNQWSVEMNSIHFLFYGRCLRGYQTPDELDMKDGDEIDVMLLEVREMLALGVTQQHDQSTLIKLKVNGLDGDEIYFWIKRDHELEKLMNAYCDRRSVEMNSIHFLFYGRRLRGTLTPNELGMKDGGKIDVMLREARKMLASRVTQQHDQSTHINLKVNGQDGDEIYFQINRDHELEKLMNAYCDRRSVEMNSIHFLFYGRRLRGDQTPDELDMKDGDEIDVMLREAREMLALGVTQQHDQSTLIKLKVNGPDGDEIYFWIKRDHELEKLMNAYCDRRSVEMKSMHFLFYDRHLRGDLTPNELEMKDGDEIDVMLRGICTLAEMVPLT